MTAGEQANMSKHINCQCWWCKLISTDKVHIHNMLERKSKVVYSAVHFELEPCLASKIGVNSTHFPIATYWFSLPFTTHSSNANLSFQKSLFLALTYVSTVIRRLVWLSTTIDWPFELFALAENEMNTSKWLNAGQASSRGRHGDGVKPLE